MAGFLSNIKSKISGAMGKPDETMLGDGKEYVELETEVAEEKGKVVVKPYVIEDFADIKDILDALREGSTIALINIKALKDKDMIELKRAINKLKKTTDAIEGDIAGFGEDYIVVTPGFARIHRAKGMTAPEKIEQG